MLMTIVGGLVMSIAFASCNLTPSLQTFVDKLNEDCPKDFGEGMIITKAELTDNHIVMRAEVDEDQSILAIFLIDEMGDALTKELEEKEFNELKNMFLNDNDLKDLFKQCKKEHKGFKITLTGNKSGKTADFLEITPEEIQKLEF